MDLVRPPTWTERSRPCSHGSLSSISSIVAFASSRTCSYSTKREEICCDSPSYSWGKRYLNERSASSVLYCHMPRRWASGAKISRVSRAIDARFSTGMYCSVRMLCMRSASFTTTMRQSSAIAMNMERIFSICSISLEVGLSSVPRSWRSIVERTIFGSLLTLVSPSTILRTVCPKSVSTSLNDRHVSSTVSWRRPEMMVELSICEPARIPATATGCDTNASPDLRFCP
mmetsp:Transcript_22064/g.56334  ORF Transcript_22064/g.56334 Transcript_22064/m.56334 type:complete len:229 (-) Transcript_22064:405-1091(-)